MYFVMKTPADDAVVASAELDAGPEETTNGKGKRKRRGKRRRRGGKQVAGNGSGELQVIDERILLTPADRKMVWRGPAVRLPEKNVDFGSGGDGRSLDQSEINASVRGGQGAVVRCIADARGQAELVASIKLKFLVESGRVGKVRVQAPSYLIKNGLYDCAVRAVRSMSFPNTGGATVVTVPLDLGI